VPYSSCNICGVSYRPGNGPHICTVDDLLSVIDQLKDELPVEERLRIITWLRVKYELNRNAQEFANAIEDEEHMTWARKWLASPDDE
jgi:hypothetical protein